MKYLIISDAGSMHVYNFVKEMLSGRGYEIYILSHSVGEIPEQYRNYYEENNITVFSLRYAGHKNLYARNKWNVLVKFLKKCAFLHSLGAIDICHIHYIHNASLLLMRLFRWRIRKIILSYWGDDILIPSEREVFLQRRLLPQADAITVTVKNSYNVFQKRFGHRYDAKLRVVHFAAGGVGKIRELAAKFSKDECRAMFNVPAGKLLMVCGYNADPDQRQDLIAEQIGRLSDEIKDRLHLLIPLQYGRINEQYIKRVKGSFAKCGCSHAILETYVPFERNAIMSLASDIYLNLRKSDAFSNAMKEQVCAGTYLITGSWLNYLELDESGAPASKIDTFDELPQVITHVVKNFNFSQTNVIFEPFYRLFAKKYARAEWEHFLNNVEKP